jgi:mannitol/fructose-specific phosphotransferase system IIA component (Ntr-type)
MPETWLPQLTLEKRRQLQEALIDQPETSRPIRFTESLTAQNIIHFTEPATKIEIVEALTGTLIGINRAMALRSIWQRERDGSLTISPDVAIVRGRMEKVHHIRAALGLCPEGVPDPSNPQGKTRIFVLFVGPVDQTTLHMKFLSGISTLMHNRCIVKKLLKSRNPEEAYRFLQGVDL